MDRESSNIRARLRRTAEGLIFDQPVAMGFMTKRSKIL